MPAHKSVIPLNVIMYVHDNIYRQHFLWRGKPANRYLVMTVCAICEKEYLRDIINSRKYKRGFCSRACQKVGSSGSGNPNWGGGRKGKRGNGKGYILIYMPEHPYAKKGFVPEHRLVVEKRLGRFLSPNERVHHKNLNIQDNTPSNLVHTANHIEHFITHGSLNRCVEELMRRGFLVFNDELLKYEVKK